MVTVCCCLTERVSACERTTAIGWQNNFGVAQMEKLADILENKRQTAELYNRFFKDKEIEFIKENPETKANYWLNCIKFKDKRERDMFLEESNYNSIMTRPVWRLMNKLGIYRECQKGNFNNAKFLADIVVNLPSGYRLI